jgi:ribulose-5-phosphate 4-epimerase/fuculose-1-phosphate aldolase
VDRGRRLHLVKVDMDEDLDERAGVNRPGFTLHSGVLGGRADVNCAVHVHTRTGMAIAGLKGGLKNPTTGEVDEV